MRSWVRYSITVYLGLLLAGSIASPGVLTRPAEPPMASVYQRPTTPAMRQAPLYQPPSEHTQRPPARAES
jgi:hypothetical protein